MDDAVRELKRRLRRQARLTRQALDPGWRERASAAIAAAVVNLPEVQSAETRSVAVFASVGDEVDTRPLLERLIALKGGVLLPRVVKGEKRLEFRRVGSLGAGLVPAFQGIPEPDPAAWPEVVEPAAMDLIVVPGLLYDRRGYRIGYGGGFYDRLLALPRRCRAVGIAFSPLLREQPLPIIPHDRRVDALLTETGLVNLIP